MTTTRAEMCADLARAMGWTLVNWSWIDPVDARQYRHPPDPFASAEDSRALVVWLATQSVEIQCRFDKALSELLESAPDDLRPLSLWYLTAPLPVIAEAAWKAITASSTAAQVSAEHSAGQALPQDRHSTTSSGTANQAPSE